MQLRTIVLAIAAVAIMTTPAGAQVPPAAVLPEPTDSGHVSVNGLELYYEMHGAGEPLVMLHGGVNPADMFGAPLVEMAKSARVIAVHLQGHGRTKDIDRPFAFEAMADDVALLLEKLGIERASVMGYSLGAGVAIQVAVRHPALVERLVAISVPFSSAGYFPEAQAAFAALQTNAAMIAGSVSESPLGAMYPGVDWESLFRKIGEHGQVQRDWSAEIARIAAPTLLIFADADAIRPDHMTEFYGLLGGGLRDAGLDGSGRAVHRLAIIPGTTHYDILQSSAVTQFATEFLRR